MFYVYRLRDHNDETIYVGCTYQLEKRLKYHKNMGKIIFVPEKTFIQKYTNGFLASMKESRLISTLKPKHNKRPGRYNYSDYQYAKFMNRFPSFLTTNAYKESL